MESTSHDPRCLFLSALFFSCIYLFIPVFLPSFLSFLLSFFFLFVPEFNQLAPKSINNVEDCISTNWKTGDSLAAERLVKYYS